MAGTERHAVLDETIKAEDKTREECLMMTKLAVVLALLLAVLFEASASNVKVKFIDQD